MDENTVATRVLDEAVKIHRNLGPGLLESVYEAVLCHALTKSGFKVNQQVSMPLKYNNIALSKTFVADIIVDDLVILEVKSHVSNHEIHRMQLLSYLKISEKRLGLLLNFGMARMMDGVSRVANGL